MRGRGGDGDSLSGVPCCRMYGREGSGDVSGSMGVNNRKDATV